MGLDNIPKPYPCVAMNKAIKTTDGKIDCDKTIKAGGCDFAGMKHPVGMFGTFCWFRGKALVRELGAIGYPDAEFLYESMSAEELARKADELEEYLREFKKKYGEYKEAIVGAGWNGILKDNCRIEWGEHSGYDEIVDIIEKAIQWLRNLSEIGCGVEPWY
ncbi:MAG: hypothetical protein JRI35_02960 [Deltaproteobacteria bacterium]|nr:hypothetical protein [Deltaproteobacteria bacterium]